MRQDFVCSECGHEYDELGDGKCYVCGGSVIPIEEVGEDEPEYPDELMGDEEEEGPIPPEELEDEDWEKLPQGPEHRA